jgi:hypothetical protein
MCQANYKVLPLFRNCCRQDTNLSSFFSKHKLCIYSELSCSLTTKKFVSNIEQLRKNWQNSTFTTPNPPTQSTKSPKNQMAGESVQRIVNHHRPDKCTLRCVPPPTSSTLPVPQALQRTPSPLTSIRAAERIADPPCNMGEESQTASALEPPHRRTSQTLIR